MFEFIEITPKELNENPFSLIGEKWFLITAKKNDKINTMTASWGGLGVMWKKNVVYITIRPQRYTKEFIDNSDNFSLTFFNDNMKPILNYLGKVSGKDEDKIKNVHITPIYENSIPYFKECNLAIFCKKLFKQEFNNESFIEKDIPIKIYPDNDFHTLYIGEITKILLKKHF